MTDIELIKNSIDGDELAFKQLVEKYQEMVINTCYGYVHDRDDAQDIAQEVFVKVYHSLKTFNHKSKFTTWLYRISTNLSLNYIRDNKIRKNIKRFENFISGDFKAFSTKTDNADASINNEEIANALHKAIGSLPESQRIAFTLNKYEDLSYSEIAEVMEVSLSSVESLLFRAKKNLQKKLFSFYNQI